MISLFRKGALAAAFATVLVAGLVMAPSAEAQGSDPESAAESGSGPVWSGERITFTKADGADPTAPENQDRITENVWITRGNDGGQIFNINARDDFDKAASPVGTLWAVGTTDDLPNLDFAPFREAVGSPRTVAGKDLVMYLVEEQAYVDVRFVSWSKQKKGGFSYERSTR